MALDAQMKWLIFEGVLPIFGAGVLYILWGLMIAVARGSWSPPFVWREAFDPVGWLYGALIIAIQASVRSLAASADGSSLKWWSMICAGFCFMFLLAAMSERGRDAQWRPGPILKFFASLTVIAALSVGFLAQPISTSGTNSRPVTEVQDVVRRAN